MATNQSKASEAAQKLALKLLACAPGQYEQLPTWEEAAVLIDAALVELMDAIDYALEAKRIDGHPQLEGPQAITLSSAAAQWNPARALAPWEPKGGE